MSADLVVVGASWGGMDAVGSVLADLEPDGMPPLVVAQHRHADGPEGVLVRALQDRSRLRVVEADDKMPLQPETVFVAPADYHLLVEEGRLALSLEPPVRFSRPSIDALFESAAEVYGPAVVAVVLTGANDDGTRGLSAVKVAGGRTIVQDPATADREEMPRAAIDAGLADEVLPLSEIPLALDRLARVRL
jgi:two-component system chemotaxis response regulator CheB